MTKKQLLKALKAELEKTILLEEADQKYWLKNLQKLPLALIEDFYRLLKPKNDLVDKYLKKAAKNDPRVLLEFKFRVKNLKEKIYGLQEKQQGKKENAESILEEELKKL